MTVITGIDTCQTLFKRHPALLQKIMEEVKAVEDAKANDIRDQTIQELKEKLELEEKRSANILEERNKLMLDLDNVKDKNDALNNLLKDTAAERDDAQQKYADLEEEYESLQTQLTQTKYDWERARDEITCLEFKVSELEVQLDGAAQ